MTDDVKERVDVAVRGACWCGLSHDGQTVFCDDPRLIGTNDPYGKPLHRERCDCREIGAAARTALRPGDEINGCVLVPKDEPNRAPDEGLKTHIIPSGIYAERPAGVPVTIFDGSVDDGYIGTPHKLLAEAHAVMRACGWQLAPASGGGDGVLNLAAAEIEEKIGALLAAAKKG